MSPQKRKIPSAPEEDKVSFDMQRLRLLGLSDEFYKDIEKVKVELADIKIITSVEESLSKREDKQEDSLIDKLLTKYGFSSRYRRYFQNYIKHGDFMRWDVGIELPRVGVYQSSQDEDRVIVEVFPEATSKDFQLAFKQVEEIRGRKPKGDISSEDKRRRALKNFEMHLLVYSLRKEKTPYKAVREAAKEVFGITLWDEEIDGIVSQLKKRIKDLPVKDS